MALRTLGDVVRRTGGAVSVRDDVSVSALGDALRAHSVDVAAVLTPAGVLAGIATASDVAKAIARGDAPASTPVRRAMTAHPTMLPPAETPANALALMRAGGFRHLPVVDPASGAVLGILDVLHLAYDAIVRLHAAYAMVPTRRSFLFQRAARATIETPTLRAFPAMADYAALSPTHTAQDACEALAAGHHSAVVIVDAHGALEGIFSCRDVVTRVLCRGLDPATTALQDVMTARPDFALPDFTVLECLQRMQACGFRHLPVVDVVAGGDTSAQAVIGLVDVLQLASDALSGLAGLTNAEVAKARLAGQGAPAPASSAAAPLTSLFSSLFSSSTPAQATTLPPPPPPPAPARATAPPSRSRSREPAGGAAVEGARQISTLDAADLARIRMSSHYAPGAARNGGRGVSAAGGRGDARQAAPSGRFESVTFKFKDCNGEYRRVKMPRVATRGAYDELVVGVRHRYFNEEDGGSGGAIRIKYIDEDGDPVVISSDDDLAACFDECADLGLKTVKLNVTDAHAHAQSRRSVASVPSSVSSLPGTPPHPHAPMTSSISSAPTAAGEAHEPGDRSRRASSSLTGGESADVASRPASVTGSAAAISLPGGSEPSSPGASPSTSRAVEAHQLMMDQRVAQAIAKYDEAVEINSSNARAFAGRGAAKLISGDTAAAEGDYRAALTLLEEESNRAGSLHGDGERTFDMAVVGLVETLIDQRRYEEAGEMSSKLDGKPAQVGCADALRDELEGSTQLATTALMEEKFGEGMTFFTNALRVESAYLRASEGRETASASLRNGRAKCYVGMGDFEMALDDFDAGVQLDGESVAALKGCGKCYMELDQADRALDAFQKARKLDAADEHTLEQIRVLEGAMPDPAAEKKDAIAKLGAMLGGMNLPTTESGAEAPPLSTNPSIDAVKAENLPRPAPASRSTSTMSAEGGSMSAFDKRSKRKKRSAAKKKAAATAQAGL